MNGIVGEIVAFVKRYFVRVICGSKQSVRWLSVIALSLFDALLGAWGRRWLSDLWRLKEAKLGKIEAETSLEKAKAEKLSAEAKEAENRANLSKRKDSIARTEKQLKRAELAKIQAEAYAIRMDAETRRILAIAEAF